MPSVVFYFIALGVMLIEGVVLAAFGVQGWAFQTPVVVAIYLGLQREFVPGGLILTGLLAPVEWLVAGVFGIYSLALVGVFFVMSLLRGQVQSSWGSARAIVAGIASLIHSAILLIGFAMMSDSGKGLVAAVGWEMGQAALIVAVMAVLMGKVFARLDSMMDPRRGRKQLEF